MKLFKSIFICCSIWLLAGLLNALLFATWLSLFTTEFHHWPRTFGLALIFSLLFSVPGMFIFWVVFVVNWSCDLLFRHLLNAGLILSVLSSLLLFLFDGEIQKQQFVLACYIVIAALSSIMIHHTFIKNSF